MPNEPRHIYTADGLVRAEADALANMIAANERRIDELRDALPRLMREAIDSALTGSLLSAEERQWVRLAIQREAQSIRLRQAIIEKSLSALVWAAIVGAGVIVYEYMVSHGWKP